MVYVVVIMRVVDDMHSSSYRLVREKILVTIVLQYH